MIVKTFEAMPGKPLSDEDAERIGRFLDEKFGDDPYQPKDVVGAARSKRSPIHGDFEWDNDVAGEKYRIVQAREIIRSIAVIYATDDARVPTRAYHSVVVTDKDGDKHAVYVPTQVVWQNDDFSAQVVTQARRDLESWVHRNRQYKELAATVPLVERALQEIAV